MSRFLAATAVVLMLALTGGRADAYSANKIWFEFRPDGICRVHVNYTVPELKEFRESYVEFKNRKDAERYYWDLVKGADFFPPDPKTRRFVSAPLEPDPW